MEAKVEKPTPICHCWGCAIGGKCEYKSPTCKTGRILWNWAMFHGGEILNENEELDMAHVSAVQEFNKCFRQHMDRCAECTTDYEQVNQKVSELALLLNISRATVQSWIRKSVLDRALCHACGSEVLLPPGNMGKQPGKPAQ